MILESMVRLDTLDLILADNIGRVLVGEALDLCPRRLGVWVENAYDVGDVVVREARVLFAYTARVKDILGRWREKSRWSVSFKYPK